ncbi:phage tail protein [Shewanella algae]|uniref:phage tail-collar fiber domain-containing protein n=1 Tax=Shewanella algae TaxID=38313 RepID=UPI0031F48289
MSQNIIPSAFEAYRTQCELSGQSVVLDEILLANIPDLDPNAPVDRNQVECQAQWIVHRQAPTQVGALNHNAIAYALVLDTRVGDFAFNAIFLTNKASGTIGMAIYKGMEHKFASTESQTGNSLVKTLVMAYDGAAQATHLRVDASTWMVDYQQRFAGLMQDDATANQDIYGPAAFLGQGFAPIHQDGQWYCEAGTGYVDGLRVHTPDRIAIGGNGPMLVLDLWQAGTATGAWETRFTLQHLTSVPAPYTDEQGFKHHFALLARWEGEQWRDARLKGGLEQHLLDADPHSQYLQKSQISQATDLDSAVHVPSSAALAILKKRLDYSVALGQGAVTDMGPWSAASGKYPAKPYITDDQGQGRLVSAFWFVTAAGTVDGVQYSAGDKLNYSPREDAFFKTDNTESVTSVNGRMGAVTFTLNDLTGIAGNSAKLEGKSKAQVIAEARSGLASSSHTHDDRYLGLAAKAADSAKLEGKTKAQVVSEARSGLSVNGHTHDDRYFTEAEANSRFLGKTARAADSTLLEGRTKAQVVSEARSGLSANGHTHDDRYYTEAEANSRFQPKGSYLPTTGKAVDSAKLEGRTKAQVIAEARSGLATGSHTHPWSQISSRPIFSAGNVRAQGLSSPLVISHTSGPILTVASHTQTLELSVNVVGQVDNTWNEVRPVHFELDILAGNTKIGTAYAYQTLTWVEKKFALNFHWAGLVGNYRGKAITLSMRCMKGYKMSSQGGTLCMKQYPAN